MGYSDIVWIDRGCYGMGYVYWCVQIVCPSDRVPVKTHAQTGVTGMTASGRQT